MEVVATLKGFVDSSCEVGSIIGTFDGVAGDLRQRVKDGKVAFNFNLELAQPEDKIDSVMAPTPEC